MHFELTIVGTTTGSVGDIAQAAVQAAAEAGGRAVIGNYVDEQSRGRTVEPVDRLEAIDFASDETAEYAFGRLTTSDFRGRLGSGKDGAFTKRDVEAIEGGRPTAQEQLEAEAEDVEPEDPADE